MGRNKNIEKGGAKEIKRDVIPPLQVLLREDYLTAILLTILTLVVYAFTAAPGVTLEDSGDFINGVLTLGIVHPPGYPLYTVLGHLFSLLPFGEPAFRVNLFSALWGALCLGVVFLILRMLSIGKTHAVFSTLFLGFTTVFWSKTAVAEVYSFNVFLTACIVFWILSYNRDKKKSQLYLIFLTTGLALSNHYPLVILSSVGLVFLLDRRRLHPIDAFKGLIFLGLGLTPYIYLFIQASNPELQYNFGRLSDFAMVLEHILRKRYPSEFGGTLWDKFVLSIWFLKTIPTNFLLSSLFLFYGIIFSFLAKWKYRYPILIAALGPSLGLILILTFPSDDRLGFRFYLSDFSVPAYLFLSIFLSLGLSKLLNACLRNNILQVALLLILFLTQFSFNFRTSSHHNDRLAEIWATELLSSLKPGSILILCSPTPISYFAIYHVQLIKGIRPDVTLYDRWAWWTKESLYGPEVLLGRGDAGQIRKRIENKLINNSPRPVYYTCKSAIDERKISFSPTPYVYRADKRHSEAMGSSPIRVSDRLLESVLNDYPKAEYRLDKARSAIFSRSITYYGGHSLSDLNRVLNYLMKSKYYSDIGLVLELANNLYYFKDYELAGKFYARAEEISLEDFGPTDLAVFCDILAIARNYDKALGICLRREQASDPCEVNTVKTRQTIAYIYKEQDNWPRVAQYSRRILECQPEHKTAQRYLELATRRTN